ncbi:MAG: esterase/lipase family protein [Bacillota bacterium]
MRKLFLMLLCSSVLLLIGAIPAFAATGQNDYPIVLLHGWTGWGRDELLGFKYWGATGDIEEALNDSGYTTYTAVVGPISSNWDRACELYAYIKGGTVDYGKVHSEKYGHARYGRTFPGLYREWGTLDENDQIRKIHIIGHSMGGQTARVLVQLLTQGSDEEKNGTPAGDLSPLFSGGKNWVCSVTSISTPHDGTTLADMADFIPNTGQLLGALAALVGTSSDNTFYDLKMDQWGLKRKSGESMNDYLNRVFESSIWKDNNDVSNWDLSTDGARELNSWVKAQPDVYYFSWSTEATFKDPLTGHQVPELNMNPLFSIFSIAMGSYTSNKPGHVVVDKSWWQNDGVVNTRSMAGPSTDDIVKFNGTPVKGKWNNMGVVNSFDHMDIVGLTKSKTETYNWYRARAALLASLPKD